MKSTFAEIRAVLFSILTTHVSSRV